MVLVEIQVSGAFQKQGYISVSVSGPSHSSSQHQWFIFREKVGKNELISFSYISKSPIECRALCKKGEDWLVSIEPRIRKRIGILVQ